MELSLVLIWSSRAWTMASMAVRAASEAARGLVVMTTPPLLLELLLLPTLPLNCLPAGAVVGGGDCKKE